MYVRRKSAKIQQSNREEHKNNDKTGIRNLEVYTRAMVNHLSRGQDELDYQLVSEHAFD